MSAYGQNRASPPILTGQTGRLLAFARTLQAMLDSPDFGADEIAAYVALARYANDDGACHPAQGTIAEQLQRSRSWVNRAIGRLDALGAVRKHRHHLPKGGETSCRYVLPALSVSGRAEGVRQVHRPAPATVTAQPERAAIPCAPKHTACAPKAAPCAPEHTNRVQHQPIQHQPSDVGARDNGQTDGESVVSLEVRRLSKAIHQACAGPWFLDTAQSDVADAVERAGLDAVKRVAEDVRGAGLLAWEIQRRLAALPPLTPSAPPSPAEPGTATAAQPTPRPGAQVTGYPKTVDGIATALRSVGPGTLATWWDRARRRDSSLTDADRRNLARWVPAIAPVFAEVGPLGAF